MTGLTGLETNSGNDRFDRFWDVANIPTDLPDDLPDDLPGLWKVTSHPFSDIPMSLNIYFINATEIEMAFEMTFETLGGAFQRSS
jgi:hypothetical protein